MALLAGFGSRKPCPLGPPLTTHFLPLNSGLLRFEACHVWPTLRPPLLGWAATTVHSLAPRGKWLINGTAAPLKNSSFLLEPARAIQESRRGSTLSRPVKTRWLFRVRESSIRKLEPLKTPLTLGSVRKLPMPRAKVSGMYFPPCSTP